jgi:hypothetical protein
VRLAIRRLPTLSFENMGTRDHYSTIWGKGDLVTEEWQVNVRFCLLGFAAAMLLEQMRGCLESLYMSDQS